MPIHIFIGGLASIRGLAFTLTLLLAACSKSGDAPNETPEPPDPDPEPRALILPVADTGDWPVAQPSSAAEAALIELANDVGAGTYPTIDGIAIAHSGELLFDLTFRKVTDRFDQDVGNANIRLHAMMSVTKSLTGILAGVAIEQGGLPDVSTPYLELFPDRTFANPSEEKTQMTLQHVLQMQLGLDWNEWEPGYGSPDNRLNRFLREEVDHTQALLDLPMAATPGDTFAYNTIATNTLGDAIQNYQPLALEDYAATWLLLPLGITEFAASRTPTGLPELGRGLFLTNRDLLKFGQLLLDGGTWQQQQIVSAEWLDEMLNRWTTFVVSEPTSAWTPTGYGYLWWLGELTTASGTYQTRVARGYGDQLLVVIDQLDTVIAITSNAYDESHEDALFDLVAERIVPAITGM